MPNSQSIIASRHTYDPSGEAGLGALEVLVVGHPACVDVRALAGTNSLSASRVDFVPRGRGAFGRIAAQSALRLPMGRIGAAVRFLVWHEMRASRRRRHAWRA